MRLLGLIRSEVETSGLTDDCTTLTLILPSTLSSFVPSPISLSPLSPSVPSPISSDVGENDYMGFPNYDGEPIPDNFHCLRVDKSVDIWNNTATGPVVFGFETIEELWSFLNVGIENAKPQDLQFKFCSIGDDSQSDGDSWIKSTPLGRVMFSIDLRLRHNQVDAFLSSTDTQISDILLGNEPHDTNPDIVREFGFYMSYHVLVERKINQLIEASVNDPRIPFRAFECYRVECLDCNLYPKITLDTMVMCTSCSLGELCTSCGKYVHDCDCKRRDADLAELRIHMECKPCPNCRVPHEKVHGSANHMLCTFCRAHFCWTCEEQYTIDKIADHYMNMSSFGICRPHV